MLSLVKGFGLGDDEVGVGVILILGCSVLVLDFDVFDDGVDLVVVCVCLLFDEVVFGFGDVGVVEVGGLLSLVNCFVWICGIVEFVSYLLERLIC